MSKIFEMVAQCWCDEETSHIPMNAALAKAFAKRLKVLLDRQAEAVALIVKKSPDEVNALHDILCVLTDAPSITNRDTLKAIEAAERGELFKLKEPEDE